MGKSLLFVIAMCVSSPAFGLPEIIKDRMSVFLFENSNMRIINIWVDDNRLIVQSPFNNEGLTPKIVWDRMYASKICSEAGYLGAVEPFTVTFVDFIDETFIENGDSDIRVNTSYTKVCDFSTFSFDEENFRR